MCARDACPTPAPLGRVAIIDARTPLLTTRARVQTFFGWCKKLFLEYCQIQKLFLEYSQIRAAPKYSQIMPGIISAPLQWPAGGAEPFLHASHSCMRAIPACYRGSTKDSACYRGSTKDSGFPPQGSIRHFAP